MNFTKFGGLIPESTQDTTAELHFHQSLCNTITGDVLF